MITIERVRDYYRVTKDNESKTYKTLKEAAEWAEGSNMLIKTKRDRELEEKIDELEVQNNTMKIMLARNEEKIESFSHSIDFYRENFIKEKNKSIELKRERDHFKSLYESLQVRFDYIERGGHEQKRAD